MSALNDFYFFVRRRTRVCRFCGKKFTTTCPAKKTCDSPACKRKSRELIKKQNAAANSRYQARKRRGFVEMFGRNI